ncbi:endonuclease-reverse transcriptase [Elysia marginata]|uniref:Endonuclease-reverse transcriptase n=1 Tax=Elysia marginata TaxID=1093978 RepID=A0AAV4JRF1_9GAST|nr:endonuclease-reverse transcriptase [Elysia marginata]
MATVRLEEDTSDWLPIKRGVRQGCILSASLFCIYTERIMREVEHDGQHLDFQAIKMNGEEVKELRYADDTALISKTPDGLNHILQSVKIHSEEKDLYLNPSKTKIMATDKCTDVPKLFVNNKELESVETFVYPGAQIQKDGKITPELRIRLAIAAGKLNKFQRLWKCQTLVTKKRTLKACIFPAATYTRPNEQCKEIEKEQYKEPKAIYKRLQEITGRKASSKSGCIK